MHPIELVTPLTPRRSSRRDHCPTRPAAFWPTPPAAA